MVAPQIINQKQKIMFMSQRIDFLLNLKIVSYGVKNFHVQILCLQIFPQFNQNAMS